MGKNRYLPFGYRIRNGEIVIEPVEANIVRKAFEEYAAGASYASNTLASVIMPTRPNGTKIW